MTNFNNLLFPLADDKFKSFQASLIPTINKDKILGISIPKLRKLANEIYLSKDFSKLYESFSKDLPHKYYEEDNLHILLINKINDLSLCINELEKLLPFVDNWASCDLIRPLAFKNIHSTSSRVFISAYIRKCLLSKHTYICRFGIVSLIYFFLDKNFDKNAFNMVSKINSDEYYVNMARAWYFTSALSKNYFEAIDILLKYKLDKWTHNKTIQKCLESNSIDKERKIFLKSLIIKSNS